MDTQILAILSCAFGAEMHVEKNESLNCSFGNALFCNANYAVDVCANASESNYKWERREYSAQKRNWLQGAKSKKEVKSVHCEDVFCSLRKKVTTKSLFAFAKRQTR